MHRAWQVQSWRLRDLDGFFHGSQQAIPSFSPQGRSKTLWMTDEQLDHNTGVLFHTLALNTKIKYKYEYVQEKIQPLYTHSVALT